MVNLEAIVWYLFLLDSLVAVVLSFCCAKWYKKNYKYFWRHFPITKGWSFAYLLFVLWVGSTLYRLGVLPY